MTFAPTDTTDFTSATATVTISVTAPSGPSVSFLKEDTTTEGNWINTYGTQGYEVIGNATSLPSYATVTPSGQTTYTWASNSTDPRALQDAGGTGRIAAAWYSTTSFTVDVNITDGNTHNLELYFVDWDNTGRSETVKISNPSNGTVLNTQTVSSFHSGVYLDYSVSGNILISITKTAGSNAVLSGLFFDPATTGDALIGGTGSGSGGITSTPAYGALDLVDPTSGPEVGRLAASASASAVVVGAGSGSTVTPDVTAIDLALEALTADIEGPSPAPSSSTHDAALEQVLEAERRMGLCKTFEKTCDIARSPCSRDTAPSLCEQGHLRRWPENAKVARTPDLPSPQSSEAPALINRDNPLRMR